MEQYNQWGANPQAQAMMANYMNGQQGQTFNLQPTIPQKRQHDGSGMSGSPPPQSRSQTPGYGNNYAAPTPYQHLQQQPGSNNATPSPTMQNQQFRPPNPQPRMAASPSPFPGQNYGNSMPGTPNAMQQGQMGQMGQYGQQYGMNPAMSMAGMPSMQAMNGMGNMPPNNATNAQRAYQAKLIAHQAQLRQQGVMPPRSVGGQPGQMGPGGQQQNAVMQQAQQKRAQFLKTLQSHAAQTGRPFNPSPMLAGKPVDLYMLWTIVTSAGGAAQVDRNNQWQQVALKMGFPQQQYPQAAEELKNIHQAAISHYERMWFQMKMQQKQEQARMHAQQMAGFSGPQQQPPQQSPTKMMPGQSQQNQYQQQLQQMAQSQQQPQGTPVQANASLQQNGMSPPQQQMAAMHHRRNSSIRKPEQMTPQPGATPATAASPLATKQQRTPSVKPELGVVMKSEELQSTNYIPQVRSIEQDGGHDIQALFELGNTISRAMPNMPAVDEMGLIDTNAITLSLASGIHGEVRYALDTLVIISHDQRVALNLEQCEDLIDVLVDCSEDQVEVLSEDAVEVSDALDLPPYEDVMRGAKAEAETLQEIAEFGSREYHLDRAADKLIAITTVLRNFSFYEFNHRLLTSTPLIKWLSNTIRLLGTRNMLLRTYYNTQDFFKDMIIFLSNVTQSLELPSRDDALHILHFLLAFAPQPAPSYSESGGKIRFASFSPLLHRYLPPAIDCLAKLLARQDPNRTLYRSIFTSNSGSLAGQESASDLLTRAFALAISVLPDRSKGSIGNTAQLRIVEARKAYLTQGMLAADILTTLAPGHDTELARSWIESEDGWAVGLLNLAALLSVDRNQAANQKSRELGMDTETFKLITHRALAMMKRLAEKAGKGSVQKLFSEANGAVSATTNGITNGVDPRDNNDDDDDLADLLSQPKWEGIPQGHAILGALMMPNTDKVALGLLCGLHEMAMQHN